MFKHTRYYNNDTAVPSPVDWGDQSRCFQLFFDVLHDVTVNMTRVRRRICRVSICVNMRQYASICVNTHVTCVNMRQYAACQYASICVNTRQYAS